MQTKNQRTAEPDPQSPRGSGPRPHPPIELRRSASRTTENAFSAHFLDRARRREVAPGAGEALGETPLSRQAHWSGPWEVTGAPAGDSTVHVVARRGEQTSDLDEADGGPRLAFLRRQDALLAAASLAALATPNHLGVSPGKKRSRLGHPIHEGSRHLGHVSAAVRGVEEEFLVAFHTARSLAANPEAAALLVEALDTETLGILGRAIMRRLG